MRCLRWLCPLAVAALGFAQVVMASEPQVTLTSVTGDEQLSRHQPYLITWSSAGLPARSALSLRLRWTAPGSGMTPGGVPQAGEQRRLITTVLDEEAMKSFLTGMPAHSGVTYPTIESGQYTWDVDKYCRQNTDNGHSICMSGIKYHLEAVVRAASDACGDNERCDKPRTLYMTLLSRGTISFVD